MKCDSYIVEGTNWKCKVSLESSLQLDVNNKMVEAATRCIEHLFNGQNEEFVNIFELKDREGRDYFKEKDLDDVPDPSFGLLTKIYKTKDKTNSGNHYVIKTRTLMENASIVDAIHLMTKLEEDTKKSNPYLFKTINKLLKNRLIFKLGDLENH